MMERRVTLEELKGRPWEETLRDVADQQERLLITRDGKPVVLIVGVKGMDEEQLQLGSSDNFWELITERRQQKTLSRTQLEERLKSANTP